MDTVIAFCLWQFWGQGESRRPHNLLLEDLARGDRVIYVWCGKARPEDRSDDAREIISKIAAANPSHRSLYDSLAVVHFDVTSGALTSVYPEVGRDVEIEALLSEGKTYARVHTPIAALLPVIRLLRDLRIPMLYDRMDNWPEFPDYPGREVGSFDTELEFSRLACGVTGVTVDLTRDLVPANPVSKVIPNAVSRFFLERLRGQPRRLPKVRPLVLYMGSMSLSYFDWDIAHGLVTDCPDYDFLFVGRRDYSGHSSVAGQLASWEARIKSASEKVSFENWVPHGELPSLLRRSSAAVIPFQQNEITAGVIPLKVFEYIAAGLPVVASGLPSITSFPLVRAAKDHHAMAASLKQCLEVPLSQADLDAAADFIERNTWCERSLEMKEFAFAAAAGQDR